VRQAQLGAFLQGESPCGVRIREYLEAAVKISKGAKVREVEVPV